MKTSSMGFAKGMASANKGDCLSIVKGHALREDLMDVETTCHGVAWTVDRASGVDVDQTHRSLNEKAK